jgi:hypothetical protein
MPRGIDPRDSAYLQGRLWTPAVLRPAAWYDAADLSTISVSTGVSEWRDKSGNARHMTQATSSIQPLFVPEYKNGLGAVNFRGQKTSDGVGQDDYLAMAASVSVITAFCVCIRSAASANNFVFTSGNSYDWHGTGASGGVMGPLADSSNSSSNWRSGTNRSNGLSITVTSYSGQDIWTLYSFLCSGNMEVQSIGRDRFNLNGGVGYHTTKGHYCEVLFTQNQLETARVNMVEGYLSWKWGIPLAADHPFANRPPLIGD